MVKIVPFRGFRFNKSKIGEYSKVIAPPYDVIDPKVQKILHARSEYNISKITRAIKHDDDTDTNNEYTRGAELLNQWISEGVLIRDDKPAIYVLAQEFSIGSGAQQKTFTRIGFIALLKLEEFCTGGVGIEGEHDGTTTGTACIGVHQHEETLPKDIEDRLCLCRSTLTNFGQIFATFPDRGRKTEALLDQVTAGEPAMVAKDDDGVIHKLWLMEDESQVTELQQILANKSIIIADGHHRYKTALQLHKEHDTPDDPIYESSRYRMMTFVNMMNKGLVILPTHRLIQHIDDFDPERFINVLESNFTTEKFHIDGDYDGEGGNDDDHGGSARNAMFDSMDRAFETGKHAFGLYCKTGNYYLLTLKDETLMDKVPDKSAAWRKLDVSILHQLILEDLLGIDKTKLESGTITGGAYVEYIKDIGDAVHKAVDKVDHAGYQAVFFMNPTPISEVEAVATNHETMPQKSTFFHPKIFTGYVINKL